MAEKQAPSRRGGASTQNAPRRNDVIRCDKCGEYYATTYKRCPFCDERPGRGGGSGRRVANTRGGGYGGPVNPVQVVALVISLVLIIAALFIVFTKLLPLFTQDKDGGSSSAGTSQSTSIGGSTSTSSPDGSSPNSSQSGGDQSEQPDPQPDPEPVAVSSLTLNKSDITLQANETFEFVVKVDPADATVAWSSSDESVLTVTQDGMITNVIPPVIWSRSRSPPPPETRPPSVLFTAGVLAPPPAAAPAARVEILAPPVGTLELPAPSPLTRPPPL